MHANEAERQSTLQSKCQWGKVQKVDWDVKLDIEQSTFRSVCLRAAGLLLDKKRGSVIS